MLTIHEREMLTNAILEIMNHCNYTRVCHCYDCHFWGTAMQREPAASDLPDKHCRHWGADRHYDDYCSDAVKVYK